ncbi:MAG: tetratricopeptide repeat protein [Syntrophaceae bacterium]|nr:tetratricopeptide repeat protein [Syntrophaceae bacterium]
MLNINPQKQKLVIYVILTFAVLAVFWQVSQFDFINLDDPTYVIKNIFVRSGFTSDALRWAFSTTDADFWHPLTWLSLMFDFQLFSLNAGAYHMTSLILHILSALLLFRLFNHMTGEIWKSAFVATIFALHPLHVESVAWIAARKDVLSVFFWMLTLCLYVHYTQKPTIKRYLLVFLCFACALMSKTMVVSLPVVMILLDYWPLGRFQSHKGNVILWQLKEKALFFILAVIFSIITLYAQSEATAKYFFLPFVYRLANAPVSFMTYLEKTFWPHDLTIFYPFSYKIPVGQVLGTTLLIVVISVIIIAVMRRLPYLFVGWLWYAITLLPVIGIIQIGNHTIADRYSYLPSIGIAVMMAWSVPFLIKSKDMRKKILFPMGIAFLAIMALLTWQQCSYWKNSITLFSQALRINSNNFRAHNFLAHALAEERKFKEAIRHFDKAIQISQDNYLLYYNRGLAYTKLGQHQNALESFTEAIRLKPDSVDSYVNRGIVYAKLDQYQTAIEDFNKAISLKEDTYIYTLRSIVYFTQKNKKSGCRDAQKACALGNCKILEAAQKRKYCR